MSKPIMLSVNIPFPGFYESLYSSEIDHEESQWCEHEANERDDGEAQHPEELRLTADELGGRTRRTHLASRRLFKGACRNRPNVCRRFRL